MKLLVVGGAGYIGGVTARMAGQAGHTVTIFDNLSTGFKSNAGGAEFIQGDLTDAKAVEQLFEGRDYDLVLHFAAKLDVGESMEQPKLYFDNNVGGSINLIDAAAKAKVPIIFSSSATVYGEPKTVPITEDFPIRPINPYGYSKVMTEQLLESYQKTDGLGWLALRYFNPVGSYAGIGQNPKVSNLIPAALQALKSGTPLNIFGNDYDTPDGTCIRDYIDIRDLAEAHLVAAEKMVGGEMFNRAINLGSEQGYTVLQAIDALGKAVGAEIPRQFVSRRAGDAPQSVASSALAKQLLGWEAKHGLDEMMATAYEGYQSQATKK
jgi:UDP-glucose 4-epimerase